MRKKFDMVVNASIDVDSLLSEILKLPSDIRLKIAYSVVSCLPENDRNKLYKFMDKYGEIADWVELKKKK